MENLGSYFARGTTGLPGCGEDDCAVAATAPGEEKVIGAEQQRREEDRIASPVSASDGATRSGTDENRTKIRSTSIAEDALKIPLDVKDEKLYQDVVHYINVMYEGPIEGLDWDEDTILRKIDYYEKNLKVDHRIDSEYLGFAAYLEGPQLSKLNERLALYRIRAYEEELREVEDAELKRMYGSLENEGYFEKYERYFDWYFDPTYCQFSYLEDYQRLVLRDNGQYEEWENYRGSCNTLEGDLQFVQFWERLAVKTKWLADCVATSLHVWLRFERVAFYHALKIAAGISWPSDSLFFSSFNYYLWIVTYETPLFEYYVDFYMMIWKLVAKDKMDFKEALRKVYDDNILYSRHRSGLNAELDMLDSDETSNPGPVQRKYEAYIAKISGEIPRHKTYYDYVERKLDIAKEIGLIKPSQKCA